jgi:tetratricopeptide (TPR) repeat protein
VAFDRENTLKKGEKFLRQGRLDAAIAEYLRVVEEQPRDWNTANLLGDLYLRASQTEQALSQYNRIADHLLREGFYPKAAALYKKVLKIKPDDEGTELVLADISTRQGLLAEAKNYLRTVEGRRRGRGDRDGVADIAIRLGSLDPTDFGVRLESARTLEEMGRGDDAGIRFRSIHDDLAEAGRETEALDALRDAVRLNPSDRDGRVILARARVAAGDVLGARDYLDRQTAGDDPVLLSALVELELRSGQVEPARELMAGLLSADPTMRERLLSTAWTLVDTDADAAYACVDVVSDSQVATAEFRSAASDLREFASRRPGHVPALLKLVGVCVDGGLDHEMHDAQVLLVDAYLEHGHASEARVIAEDLVARDSSDKAHIDRYRRALVLLNVEDPDAHIAERTEGRLSFLSNEPFVDLSTDHEPSFAALEAATAAAIPDVVEPDVVKSVVAEPGVVELGVVEMDASMAAPPRGGKRASKPQPASSGEIDLTSALGNLDTVATAVETSSDLLDDVFEDLRAETEKEDEFAAQYVKLAKTYVEMGMTDEAIESLKTAARSARHRFEAASMLGRLYKQRQQTPQAIEWLEHAAEEPAPTAEDGRALLYDLGVMLDGTEETARALAVFLELQADAGDYRDVPARIDRLARVQSGG